MSIHEIAEHGEVYDDWGDPPCVSRCKDCGASYYEDWSGTTCLRCDGDIVKVQINEQ